MRRLKLGDMFHISFKVGQYFMQLIGKDETFGSVVRVISNSEGQDLELFSIIFPVSAGVRDGYLTYLRTERVPEKYENGLYFKYPNFSLETGELVSWTIKESGTRKIVKNLDSVQIYYPYAAAVNIAKLEELIDFRWDGRSPMI